MPYGEPERGTEGPQEFTTTVARWEAELAAAEKVLKPWRESCKNIDARYTLEKNRVDLGHLFGESDSRFNILWSNIQTLKPAVYAQEPVPVVKRRHRDADPAGRIAAEMLERALKSELERDERMGCGMDEALSRANLDYLLFARGSAWVRYEPDMEGDTVLDESCPTDYVGRNDLLYSPKRTWAEVVKDGWVARRTSMTRARGVGRFGEVFRNVPLDVGEDGTEIDERDQEVIGQADVWEIWDAASRKVFWVSRAWTDRILEEKDDPLKLEGFFPCPKPAFGTVSNESLVPVPDYRQYAKLAQELDDQTARIDGLVNALRAKGFYDASIEGLETLMNENADVLVPVTNMQNILGKGSGGGQITGVVQFFPLDTIARALTGLYDARDRTKQTLYEVSGVADILRGAVDPREKLGQSRIKEQNAGRRIDVKRREIENLARDCIRRKAELMAEHYDPERLRRLSGFDQMTAVMQAEQQQPGAADRLFAEAITLLRNERLRGFRLEIETNSTMIEDDEAEREGRTEFLRAAGEFMSSSLQVVEQVPSMAPLMGQMMLFGVRGFRAGRQLEGAFEDAIEQIAAGGQDQGGESDPQAQADAEARQQEIQGQMAVKQAEAQVKHTSAAMKLQAMQEKHRLEMEKLVAEHQVSKAEHDIAMEQMEADLAKTQAELTLKEREALTAVAADTAKSQNAMRVAAEAAKRTRVQE
ncbi:MAG: hypothetical protein F4145_06360 [Boseongicola sp. SB0675_bin_26]|nr:hypothetical protein [Boseongicola sp. SB0675_bin_26]